MLPFYPKVFLKVCVHFLSHRLYISPCIFCTFFSLLPRNTRCFAVTQWLSCRFKKKSSSVLSGVVCLQVVLRGSYRGWGSCSRATSPCPASQQHLTAPTAPSPGARRRGLETRAGPSGEAGTRLLTFVVRGTPQFVIIQSPWAKKLCWSEKVKLWPYRKLLNLVVKEITCRGPFPHCLLEG